MLSVFFGEDALSMAILLPAPVETEILGANAVLGLLFEAEDELLVFNIVPNDNSVEEESLGPNGCKKNPNEKRRGEGREGRDGCIILTNF